jgi:hypothetical protein
MMTEGLVCCASCTSALQIAVPIPWFMKAEMFHKQFQSIVYRTAFKAAAPTSLLFHAGIIANPWLMKTNDFVKSMSWYKLSWQSGWLYKICISSSTCMAVFNCLSK